MTAPSILARSDTDEPTYTPDARSPTALAGEVRVPFEGGAVGEVTVQVFRSTGSEDRGGLVLRITLVDQGQSFIPYARLIPGGIEVHIAADIESKSVAGALRAALQT